MKYTPKTTEEKLILKEKSILEKINECEKSVPIELLIKFVETNMSWVSLEDKTKFKRKFLREVINGNEELKAKYLKRFEKENWKNDSNITSTILDMYFNLGKKTKEIFKETNLTIPLIYAYIRNFSKNCEKTTLEGLRQKRENIRGKHIFKRRGDGTKKVISEETKKIILNEYLKNGKTYKEIAKITNTSIYFTVKTINEFFNDNPDFSRKKNKIKKRNNHIIPEGISNYDFAKKILSEFTEGNSIKDLAKKYDTSRQSLYEILSRFEDILAEFISTRNLFESEEKKKRQERKNEQKNISSLKKIAPYNKAKELLDEYKNTKSLTKAGLKFSYITQEAYRRLTMYKDIKTEYFELRKTNHGENSAHNSERLPLE
jgi:transposase